MRLYRKTKFIFCICILLAVCTRQVFASGYDVNQICSITLQLNELETSKAGVTFELYRVGRIVDKNMTYALTEDFKDSEIDLNDLQTMKAQKQAADSLAKQLRGKTAYTVGTTDNTGRATFHSIEQGVYLVIQKEKADYGVVMPFLVFVPYFDKIQMIWQYDLFVYPKGENQENPPSGEEMTSATENDGSSTETPPTEAQTPTTENNLSTESGFSTEEGTTSSTEGNTPPPPGAEATTETGGEGTTSSSEGENPSTQDSTTDGNTATTEQGGSKKKKPKTGDDSAMVVYFIAMLICFGIALELKKELPEGIHFD